MADENAPAEPRLVQSPGGADEKDVKATENFTESAQAQFWARPHDGRDGEVKQEKASRDDQVKAFAEYASRPDIEDRQSILARENALPGQFSNENVSSGSVDDGKVGTPDGRGKETDAAKAEASSVKDLTASTNVPKA